MVNHTKIMLITAMHGLHKNHPTFDYDTLFQVVKDFKPDYVGVEIRPEDLGAEDSYLLQNYPFEMVELSRRYKSDMCFGFDWLGDDIEGKPIPHNYWEEKSLYKRLERELDKDQNYQSEELDAILSKQIEICKTASPGSFNDGKYDEITKRYYQILDEMLNDSKYEIITQIRKQRDKEINRHIISFIQEHPGKRIALVMGANHRIFVLESLKLNLEKEQFVKVPNSYS